MLADEIFLSHSNLDQSFVSVIADLLRRHGLPVWHSQTNIIGPRQWHDEIGSALKRCEWFLLVLSPNSVSSSWVKHEVLYALNKNQYADKIIPLLYQPCEYEQLSWTLPQLQIVDFTHDFENGCRTLLRIWGLGYKK